MSAEARKCILVVFTGGTIGSEARDGLIGVSRDAPRLLIEMFRVAYPEFDYVDFRQIEPVRILSENSRPLAWARITSAVLEEADPSLSGIIITHGTDTLAFASAALSFSLARIRVPIVMVSSDLPLHSPEANGLINLADAVRLILEEESPSGVFVTYRNPDGQRLVHLGSRLSSAVAPTHFFHSANQSHYGEFTKDGFIERHPGPCPLALDLITCPQLDPLFSEKVLLVRPYPGLNYATFDLSNVDIVIHDLFHSGTACTESEDDELNATWFAERCRELEVPLLLLPFPDGTDIYETSAQLAATGARPVYRVTVEAAYAKASMAAAGDRVRLLDAISRPWANEELRACNCRR